VKSVLSISNLPVEQYPGIDDIRTVSGI